MTTEKPEPNVATMTAAELEAHIDAKEKTHRAEMSALRALLKVRQLGIK